MARTEVRVSADESALKRQVVELSEDTGCGVITALISGDGSIQLQHMIGDSADLIRAAASMLIAAAALVRSHAPDCAGCAYKLARAEAALDAIGVPQHLRRAAATAEAAPH